MIAAMISAAVCGASNAAFAFIWGGVLDAFNKPREDVEEAVSVWCIRIVFIGVAAWLFNYSMQFTFLINLRSGKITLGNVD